MTFRAINTLQKQAIMYGGIRLPSFVKLLYVVLSDLYVILTDLYVDLSDRNVDLSLHQINHQQIFFLYNSHKAVII